MEAKDQRGEVMRLDSRRVAAEEALLIDARRHATKETAMESGDKMLHGSGPRMEESSVEDLEPR